MGMRGINIEEAGRLCVYRTPLIWERHKKANTTTKMPQKNKNDQLAIEPPRNVQSTLVQSPLPLKIIGMARCRGKVSIMP